jgi:NAD(P)-dependent dehydrogenase (short-subunit alcohol dehydrogenase family)
MGLSTFFHSFPRQQEKNPSARAAENTVNEYESSHFLEMIMAGTILIYGGSGGIGTATARALRGQGYSVHLVARDRGKLGVLASELGATFTVGDVTDSPTFGRATEEAGDSLEGVVYAVGSINLKSFLRLTEADFLLDYRLNALGGALAVQAALPALRKGPGITSVLFFSSVAARQGFAFHASIGMAKGAVEALTVSLAAELAPKVRVNAIAPSLIRTPLSERMVANEQASSSIAGMHAMQRLGEPGDIGAMAAFLVSSEASWITGQVIGVDGGRSSVRTTG